MIYLNENQRKKIKERREKLKEELDIKPRKTPKYELMILEELLKLGHVDERKIELSLQESEDDFNRAFFDIAVGAIKEINNPIEFNEEFVKCPQCGNDVRRFATTCPACTNKMRCRHCDTPIIVGSSYCYGCKRKI